MSAKKLNTLTETAISNLTPKRLREIFDSMDYRTENELVNAIRGYVSESHTKDEVQTKQERLLAALLLPIYQFEQIEVMK